MGARMNEDQKISPYEYTDEEILNKVHALKRHGHGTLTLEAHRACSVALELERK
jgi:hypothetical protein